MPTRVSLIFCSNIVQDEMERSNQAGAPVMPLTIVFVERKNRCNEVAEALNAEGVAALPLHGGLSQVNFESRHA